MENGGEYILAKCCIDNSLKYPYRHYICPSNLLFQKDMTLNQDVSINWHLSHYPNVKSYVFSIWAVAFIYSSFYAHESVSQEHDISNVISHTLWDMLCASCANTRSIAELWRVKIKRKKTRFESVILLKEIICQA